MRLSAGAVADLAGGRVVSHPEREIDGVSTPAEAGASDAVFVETDKHLPAALASGAGLIIAGAFADGASTEAALVICETPKLAFARLIRTLYPAEGPAIGTHCSAVVHPSVRLGAECSIGPHAVIEEDTVLGDRVVVGPSCHIGPRVAIGSETVLKANVVVYQDTVLGARVVAHAGTVLGSDGFGYVPNPATGQYETFPQIGRLVVEDDVEFGALCTVDRAALGVTRIRRGTKLDNQVHVAHNVEIGQDVVISAQTGIAGSSVLEDKVIVAGQVGIADHVRIESGAILGAQCGVPTGKVVRGPGVLFWGTPARPIKEYLKELAALARLVKKK